MRAHRFLSLFFLLLLLVVPLVQWRADALAKRSSLWTRLFSEKPTAASLKAIEEDLTDHSATLAALRPVTQQFQFHALGDAGAKVLRGRDGWLFFRPGVEAAATRGAPSEALTAIRDYHTALAARGIALLVVPVPNKESVYPDFLADTKAVSHRWHETDALFVAMRAEGIACVDLRDTFAAARATGAPPLYLAQDTHWSPAGLALAAQTMANIVREKLPRTTNLNFQTQPAPFTRHGDLLTILHTPRLLADLAPESIATARVLDAAGQPLNSDPNARVLLIGDSFLRIFEADEPGSAGFPAHLARALGEPIATLVADGGASTLVRQELFRRAALLTGKRLVIWEFVERDLRLGTDGWARVPLPPPAIPQSR